MNSMSTRENWRNVVVKAAVGMRPDRRMMCMAVRSVAKSTQLHLIWPGIDKRIDLFRTKRLVAVRTAPRCTSQCRRTQCTYGRTIRAASVRPVASASRALGYFKVTFGRTQVKSRSSVVSVRRRSRTNRIFGRTSKHTRIRSPTLVLAAARPSPSSPTYTSTRTHPA